MGLILLEVARKRGDRMAESKLDSPVRRFISAAYRYLPPQNNASPMAVAEPSSLCDVGSWAACTDVTSRVILVANGSPRKFDIARSFSLRPSVTH
jgi:hypothetical protein